MGSTWSENQSEDAQLIRAHAPCRVQLLGNRLIVLSMKSKESKVTVVLTDAGDQVIEPFLWEQRVLQTPEVELQHPGHWVDVMVALLVNQRVVTWKTERTSSTTSWPTWACGSCDLRVTVSPLSKEFLMSLTSTCDPDTRNMPWCWRPDGNRGVFVFQSVWSLH